MNSIGPSGNNVMILTLALRTTADAGDEVVNFSYIGVTAASAQTSAEYARARGTLAFRAAGNGRDLLDGDREGCGRATEFKRQPRRERQRVHLERLRLAAEPKHAVLLQNAADPESLGQWTALRRRYDLSTVDLDDVGGGNPGPLAGPERGTRGGASLGRVEMELPALVPGRSRW